ncbi:MFS general substrate transporter [Lipomyces kononenkoae]|uniref:MFS general substrate transporter n=1 Tax=Lipomyces kononenkoae TaxID=34357 RepID=A0ACC3SZZ3_LIPKO
MSAHSSTMEKEEVTSRAASGTDVEARKPHDGAAFAASFPDGGRQAWLVVVGSMIVLGCSFGYLNAFGIYETYYKQNQLRDKSSATIAWIGSLQVFSQFGSGLFAGAFFDKYGARAVMIPATIIYVFSMMMTSLCKEYYQFILAQGILGGLGVGFLFAPALSALAHYFMRKRGIAIGIAAGGSSIGGVLFPIALRSALYSRLGFGWGVRVIAFVVFALLCIACMLVKERLPHRHGAFFAKAFLQPSYTVFTAGVFLAMWGMWVPFFYLSSYAIEQTHFSDTLAFYLLAIMNAASLFGRIIPGFVADRFGRLNIFIFIVAATGIIELCWPKTTSHAGLIVWTIFFGFFSGAVISLFSAGFAQITPDPHMIGTYIGQAMAVISIAGLTGAPIAGTLLDRYGWSSTSIFGGVSLLVGAGLAAVARFLYNPDLHALV